MKGLISVEEHGLNLSTFEKSCESRIDTDVGAFLKKMLIAIVFLFELLLFIMFYRIRN